MKLRLRCRLLLLLCLSVVAVAPPLQASGRFRGSPSVDSSLPPGWTATIVGAPPTPGTLNYTAGSGQTTITGPNHFVDHQADGFQFVNQPLQGDGEIVTRVVSVTNPASYPQAGLMLRSSLAANSAFVELVAIPNGGVNFRYRPADGAEVDNDSHADVALPVWLKLARVGQNITAYKSLDGITWDNVASPDPMTLPASMYAGLAATSTDYQGGAVCTYDQLRLRQAGAPPAGPTVSIITAAGLNGVTGTVSAVTDTPGAYVLSSNGRNIDHDDRGFLFYNVPFTGDGELRLRVTGLSTLGENSNLGLMIRDSLDPGALYSTITFSTARFRREHILEVDGNPTLLDAAPAPLPVWLRMVRHGALFSAFSSLDGAAWQPLGKPVAIAIGATARFGLTMVGGGYPNEFAQATVDQVSWPQAPAPLAALDPVIAAGLTSWRKPDLNGVSCVSCHTPFAYDVAQFNFTRDDVRLAASPHLPQADADAIYDMIDKIRGQYPPAGGLKDFRTFRPLQPGHGQIIGGENASANARDAAFGFYLKDHFRIGGDRIVNLTQARAAAQELIDVNVASVPVGLKFNLWSRSVLREGAKDGGEIAEWLPSAGIQPKPEFADYWYSLQDAYLRDPSNDNFWAIYHASSLWTDLDPHNFIVGSTHPNWRYVITGQYLANSLFAHDELLKARGLPSQLNAEDGVRPLLAQRDISGATLSPFWSVGDNARVVQNMGFAGFPLRNQESVYVDLSYNGSLAEVSGWQVNDFRIPWFWMGWMMDNSLRFSGEGSTLSGEYFIGSLWSGEIDNIRTGDSDSSQGFRMHQVFFNAVQQFKLGYKPGAWRDNDGPQHFEASKGYYLGYYRWHPRSDYEFNDIGLPGANDLYRRLLSNHIRMALLIHADEARKAGGVYYGEQYTLSDLPLWRDVLHWADPDWTQADEALLADLKASLNPPLTPTDLADPDGDGQSTIVELALGTSPYVSNLPSARSQVSRTADGLLAITFTRARADFTYVVEASSDLDEWTVVATNPGTAGASVTVPDPASAQQTRRFLRLRIINTVVD